MNIIRRMPSTLLLVLWSLLIALPLYLLIISCFKTTQEIFASPLSLPEHWTLANFGRAWNQANFSTYTLNSIIVTGGSVLLVLALSALASYPLSRFKAWWVGPLSAFLLVGIMVPVRLGSVELFNMMKNLGLLNSLFGLILVYTAIRLPFAIFIMSNFMRGVPIEIEEAARLDGAGDIRLLSRIMVPQIKPAIGIVAIFTAIAVWNDFYFPLLFIFDDNLKTLPLGLTTFVGQHRTDWSLMFSGLMISMIPLTLLYSVTSRQVREGVGAGGIK